MNRLVISIFSILIFISSCEKDEWDYRDEYTGNYELEINYIHTIYEGTDFSDFHIIRIDTTYVYNGSVKKSDEFNNRIIVDWGNDTIYTDYYAGIITQQTSFEIDSSGNLNFPEPTMMYFSSSYIRNDTIMFHISIEHGLAGALYEIWRVQGLKRKK